MKWCHTIAWLTGFLDVSGGGHKFVRFSFGSFLLKNTQDSILNTQYSRLKILQLRRSVSLIKEIKYNRLHAQERARKLREDDETTDAAGLIWRSFSEVVGTVWRSSAVFPSFFLWFMQPLGPQIPRSHAALRTNVRVLNTARIWTAVSLSQVAKGVKPGL